MQEAIVDPAQSDADPQETAEWRDAFTALVTIQGPERARFVLDELVRQAHTQRVGWQPELATPYINTIGVDQQPVFPGDLAIEERLASLMRWNALAMVVRANESYGELGGHIASYKLTVINCQCVDFSVGSSSERRPGYTIPFCDVICWNTTGACKLSAGYEFAVIYTQRMNPVIHSIG